QLNNIAKQTNYNGTNLLQASATGTGTKAALSFQVGEKQADKIETKAIQANTIGYGLDTLSGVAGTGAAAAAGVSVFTRAQATAGQTAVDTAITKLNGYRGDIGSTQNQVESAVRNLMTQSTNIKAAESVIRDVDYAEESANFNKLNIISQAGSYAISQSNATQQNVLRLLQ
ncbi:flagellin, partial [Aliarcobacter cryaerophilus]|uniref:flagellin n=1 Tax=Aliarcobacter cryaerophilus TaxID=28198 RepID=UPI0021B2A5CC